MRALVLLALAALLGGCTTTSAPFYRDSVFNVGVVSLVGQHIEIAYLGMTAFGNRYEQIDATSIDLHGAFQQQLVTQLRENYNSFRVAVPDYDPDRWLEALEQPTSRRSAWLDNKLHQNFRKLEPLVHELLSQQPVDALILVIPSRAYTGTAVQPRGAALYAGGRSGGVLWSHAGIFSHLLIINGTDGSIVQARPLREPHEFNRTFDSYPVRNLKGSPLFDVVTRAPTDEDMAALKALFAELLTREHVLNAIGEVL